MQAASVASLRNEDQRSYTRERPTPRRSRSCISKGQPKLRLARLVCAPGPVGVKKPIRQGLVTQATLR